MVQHIRIIIFSTIVVNYALLTASHSHRKQHATRKVIQLLKFVYYRAWLGNIAAYSKQQVKNTKKEKNISM
jgi:hypothetical protein